MPRQFQTPEYRLDPVRDQSVYPPSEDTFLLLDALEKEHQIIRDINPSLTLEIGSGSGVVSAFLQKIISEDIERPSCVSICTDVNSKALECTRRTFQANGIRPELFNLLHCDMLTPVLNRLRNCIDILLINPPYVPTENEAKDEEELCFAGGPRGRALLDRLLPRVSDILSAKGVLYLVALQENGVDELLSSKTRQQYRIEGTAVLERQCRNERLYVLRFSRVDEVPTPIGSIQNAGGSGEAASGPPKIPSKITIHLKPVGGAPQLQKEFTKLATKPSSTVAYIQQVLRKWIKLGPSDPLFIFVNEAFAPCPEHTIGNLYECFGSKDSAKLYLQYSTCSAWG